MASLAGLARRYDERVLASIDRRRLRNHDFSIIANDCWGSAVYQRLGLRYRSPFAGLMMPAPDYIALLRDPDVVRTRELSFTDRSRHPDFHPAPAGYPIGLLDTLEVHFLHYPTAEAASEAWNRRRERLDLTRLWVKFDGSKDLAEASHRAEFDALPYEHKVMFVRDPAPEASACLLSRWCSDGAVLVRRARGEFDVVDWLNGGTGRRVRAAARLDAS